MPHRKHGRRVLQIRHVDAGSCNGCEQELTACTGPAYDWQHLGLDLVASPRHADALLVTGPMSDTMARPLNHVYSAIPQPKIVIAFGDCAAGCGVFQHAYGVRGGLDTADLTIPGCPPEPVQAIKALRTWMTTLTDPETEPKDSGRR